MIVVSNASPLIILAKTGYLDLLRLLYGSIVVPHEVRAEVVVPGVNLPGAAQVRQANWIDVRRLSDPEALSAAETKSSLAAGELAAILLAEELHADLLLLDERAARRLAAKKGLATRGCVGVLETAHRKNLLADLREPIAICYHSAPTLTEGFSTPVSTVSVSRRCSTAGSPKSQTT